MWIKMNVYNQIIDNIRILYWIVVNLKIYNYRVRRCLRYTLFINDVKM